MNENIKKFIKKVNEDEVLKIEFFEINEKLKVETDRENAITTHILPFAKKAGYDLTVEDFAIDGELSEEELKAVVGGKSGCCCIAAGGGGGTDCHNNKKYGCACVVYGQGGDGSVDDSNCACLFGGAGQDQYTLF